MDFRTFVKFNKYTKVFVGYTIKIIKSQEKATKEIREELLKLLKSNQERIHMYKMLMIKLKNILKFKEVKNG